MTDFPESVAKSEFPLIKVGNHLREARGFIALKNYEEAYKEAKSAMDVIVSEEYMPKYSSQYAEALQYAVQCAERLSKEENFPVIASYAEDGIQHYPDYEASFISIYRNCFVYVEQANLIKPVSYLTDKNYEKAREKALKIMKYADKDDFHLLYLEALRMAYKASLGFKDKKLLQALDEILKLADDGVNKHPECKVGLNRVWQQAWDSISTIPKLSKKFSSYGEKNEEQGDLHLKMFYPEQLPDGKTDAKYYLYKAMDFYKEALKIYTRMARKDEETKKNIAKCEAKLEITNKLAKGYSFLIKINLDYQRALDSFTEVLADITKVGDKNFHKADEKVLSMINHYKNIVDVIGEGKRLRDLGDRLDKLKVRLTKAQKEVGKETPKGVKVTPASFALSKRAYTIYIMPIIRDFSGETFKTAVNSKDKFWDNFLNVLYVDFTRNQGEEIATKIIKVLRKINIEAYVKYFLTKKYYKYTFINVIKSKTFWKDIRKFYADYYRKNADKEYKEYAEHIEELKAVDMDIIKHFKKKE